MKQRIKVIGITGGIASGKSTIAKMLESLGQALLMLTKSVTDSLTLNLYHKKSSIDGEIIYKTSTVESKEHKLGEIVFATEGAVCIK
jgi:dephospho-CoA kinase